MMESNVLMKRKVEACIAERVERDSRKRDVGIRMHKLFSGKDDLLWGYLKADKQKNIEEKEEIRTKLIDKVEYSYVLEERIKGFKVLPKDYKNKKSKEIQTFRNFIINYLEKKDNYISDSNAEVLWQHQARSMKKEVETSFTEIRKKQSNILYKLNKVKGIDDAIKIIKDFNVLINKIEKFETYIKNSNFFEDDYKKVRGGMVYYVKKKPLSVLFNQEFIK